MDDLSRERDRQGPHARDEIYVILEGEAVLDVEGERVPVSAGSVVHVTARKPHRFVDIRTGLRVLVIFAGSGEEERRP